jgi:hypothetical protein
MRKAVSIHSNYQRPEESHTFDGIVAPLECQHPSLNLTYALADSRHSTKPEVHSGPSAPGDERVGFAIRFLAQAWKISVAGATVWCRWCWMAGAYGAWMVRRLVCGVQRRERGVDMGGSGRGDAFDNAYAEVRTMTVGW